jgi:ABC-type dipeptide/oligopeptide/nickel transport system permease component
MGALDIVSLAILAILIVGALFLVLIVASIPGIIAKNRHRPWVEASNVAGWIGVLLPPLWMLALIAAFIRPKAGEGAQITISQDETTELATEIGKISERVTTLQNNIHDLNSGISGPSLGGLRPWS